MPTWTNATVTNDGYALQAKLLSTDKLVITRVVSGSGRAIAGQLVNQTDISDIQQTLIVESVSYDDKGNALLRILLNNKGLTASYICNQIGIYANDPDKGEILYAIAQETTGTHNIPSITEQPYGYDCGWVFVLTFSNSESISVTIDPSNVLTVEAGDAKYLQKEKAIGREIFTPAFEQVLTPNSFSDKVLESDTVGEIFNDYREPIRYSSNLLKQGNIAQGNYSSSSGSQNIATGDYSDNTGGNRNWVGAKCSGNYAGKTNMIYPILDDAVECSANIGGTGNLVTKSKSANIGGTNNVVMSENSVNIGGKDHVTIGVNSANIGGIGLEAYDYQTVVGRYNDVSTDAKKGPTSSSANTGSLFMVGIGTASTARSNALRVSADGRCYGLQSFGASGADVAEFYEWFDGNPDNEDRRGLFVTLDGRKIKLAKADDDYILGVVSAVPMIVGGIQSEQWHDMYLKDVFGQKLLETVEVEETTDEEGNIIPAHTEQRWVLNPDYDPEREYISREFRQEWSAVGIIGQVVIVDDGTCQVNGYAKPSDNGAGTASEGKTPYRVMERIDENHVLINIK